MGKKKKLYQAKRLLAMILAVTMVVGMAPSTIYAAPEDITDSADQAESGSTISVETDGGNKDASPEDTDKPPEAVNEPAEGTNDGSKPDEDAEDADPADRQTDDTGKDNSVEDKEDIGGNSQMAAEETQTKPVYEFAVDGLNTTSAYTGSCEFDLGGIQLVKTENGQTTKQAAIGTTGVTYVWKEVKGETSTAMAAGAEPVNAGDYELELTYAKQEGVHDGAQKTVAFKITKAPVTASMEPVSVKPGTTVAEVKKTTPVINSVEAVGIGLDPEDLTVTVTAVKDAVTGTELKDEDALKKGGDYALDVKPEFKAAASAEKKANYELPETFTADIGIGNAINTWLDVTLVKKWEDAGSIVTLKSYDGKPAEAPKSPDDYTAKVMYTDAADNGKELEGAKIVGKWIGYDDAGDEVEINAPVDAGDYIYRLIYTDSEGVYDECSYDISVTIAQTALKIEISNSEKLVVPLSSTVQDILSKVTYVVYDTKDETKKDIRNELLKKQIWGTSYNDSGASQIYEPVFTLQAKDKGETEYRDIDDADYELKSEETYRIVFDGKKAVYNADGTCAGRIDINHSDVNGYDNNYTTDTERKADEKTLEVEVKPAVKAKIDVSELVKAENAATLDQIGTLVSKVYDGKEIYTARSQYKNGVGLKLAEGETKITGLLQREFTYVWQVNDMAADLKDTANLNEESNWDYADTDDFTISPSFAGIYRLKIDYNGIDHNGTLYYVDEPAYVYYAIDKKKVRIAIDEEKTYETLSGRTIESFFRNNEIAWKLLESEVEEEKTATIPEGQKTKIIWKVIETDKSSTPPQTTEYLEDDWGEFDSDQKYSYQIQAADLRVYAGSSYENRYRDYSDNYVLTASNTTPLTVNPMGTTKVKFEIDSSKWVEKVKVYDNKPFAEKDLVADGLLTLKTADGTTTVENPDIRFMGYGTDHNGDDNMIDLADITEAGEYTLYAVFEGNGTYEGVTNPDTTDPIDWAVKLGKFTITQREVTLKVANLSETYTAGVTAGNILDQIPGNIRVEGHASDDAWAFTEEEERGDYYIQAWSNYGDHDEPEFKVYEKGKKTALSYYEKLSRDKSFEVRYDADQVGLADAFYTEEGDTIDFARNYKVVAGAAAEFKTRKGNSTIRSTDYRAIASVEISRAVTGMTQEVSFLRGIPYCTEVYLDEYDKTLEGNLAAFSITPPGEYDGSVPATAMYRNEIEKAGGYVVDESGYGTGSQIKFVFDANEGKKTFRIRWEDDYVETFVINFDKAAKLGNLEEAVAPKSLAFNAANTKMAVGESQQLDVKITKAQMGDIIHLGYKSDDEKTLIVSESGYVTALKEGKASIEVFPLHMVNGKLERIKDAKGKDAKGATVAITVTKMSAPKSVKAVAHGTYAEINYEIPADGYRREIYVVDNKKNPTLKKAADIEKQVVAMKNGQWKDTFAIAPIYLDRADEAYSQRKFKYTARLSGLDTTGTYTVYVRNVCAARKLADGSVITKETVDASAAGTTASFKTLKSEVEELELYFYAPQEAWDYDEYGHRLMWFSGLNNGTVTCSPYGYFDPCVADPAANASDELRIQLPFAKEDKSKYKDVYEEPKLEYTLKFASEDDDKYAAKNEVASIDKKGKIKITGLPTDDDPLEIRVSDTVSGKVAYGYISFRDRADSVTAKKKSIAMTPGQELRLGDLLTYKLGKQTLTYYEYSDLDMDVVRSAIKAQGQEDFFEVSGDWLTATGAKGGSLTLDLTDKQVAKAAKTAKDATVTIKFTTGDMAPVKQLKAFDVINDSFGLTFSHPGGADNFLLEISDNNKLIYSGRYDADSYEYWDYDKKGNWVQAGYRIWPDNIGVRLSRESSYTVTVTAQYDGIASKAASVTVKTTKIPAVSGYIGDDHYDDAPDNTIRHRGGMSLQVSDWDSGCELNEDNTSLKVLSGNSYTLTANVEFNRGRVNDTLVWTVGDAKVATVKAAAGTYCITLKGMKPGKTVLEVKSKIWGNKVIARYDIEVVAVGDAYNVVYGNAYYGDDEPGGYAEPSVEEGDTEIIYLPLGLGGERKVAADGEIYYFTFTAPKTGEYHLRNQTDDISVKFGKSTTGRPSPTSWNSIDLGWLEEGATVRLCSQASESTYGASYYIELIGQQVENLKDGQAITGKSTDSYFKFTASEAARYQFSITDQRGSSTWLYLYENESALKSDSYTISGRSVSLDNPIPKDGAVWLRSYLSSGVKYTFHAEKLGQAADITAPASVTVAAGGRQYLTYTIARDGYYEFSSDNANVAVSMKINNDSADFTSRHELHAGDTVELTIVNNGYNDATVTISAEEVTIGSVTEGTALAVEDGGVYEFKAPSAGTYDFSMSNANCELTLYDNASDAMNSGYTRTILNSGSSVEQELNADEKVWIVATLNGETACNLSVTKISADVTVGDAGTQVTLEAGKNKYLAFAAPKAGYYLIEGSAATADNFLSVELSLNGEYNDTSSGSDFSFKKKLEENDLVNLKFTDSTGSNTLTVKVTEIVVEAIPGTAFDLESENDNGGQAYKFTASEGGLYRFLMESESEYISLRLYDDLDTIWNDGDTLATDETPSSRTGEGENPTTTYYCEIDILLGTGQTVYVNPRNGASETKEVTLSASKLGEHEWTDDGVSLTINNGETAEVTYVAKETGIYTFSMSDATDMINVNVYTSYDKDGDAQLSKEVTGGTTLELPLVLAAGQPVLWEITPNGNDQEIALNASLTKELDEIKAGDTREVTCSGTDQADAATAAGFVFRAPKDGYYTFWSEGGGHDTYGYLFKFDQVEAGTCLLNKGTGESPCLEAQDGDGPNDDGGNHFKITQNLKAGQTVYLKAIMYFSENSGTFNLCVAEGQKSF